MRTPVALAGFVVLAATLVNLALFAEFLAFIPSYGITSRLVLIGFPMLLLGFVGLLAPAVLVAFAIVLVLTGTVVTEFIRPVFIVSPVLTMLGIAAAAEVLRQLVRRERLITGVHLAFIVLVFIVAVYDLRASDPYSPLLVPMIMGMSMFVALGSAHSAKSTLKSTLTVIVTLYMGYLFLAVNLAGELFASWGTYGGVLRQVSTGEDSALYQPTSLDWLFNMIALLSFGMASAAKGKFRIVLAFLFFIFASASLLTFTRGSFAGLTIGIGAVVFVRRNTNRTEVVWVLLLISGILAVAYFSGAWSYNSNRGLGSELHLFDSGSRLALAIEGIRLMPQAVFFGAGPIGSAHHSAFLDMWTNYGGVFAVSFWGFLAVLLRRAYRMARFSASGDGRFTSVVSVGLFASFAGAFAQSLVDPTFFTVAFAFIFWLLRGLEAGLWRANETYRTRAGRA